MSSSRHERLPDLACDERLAILLPERVSTVRAKRSREDVHSR